jgi:hypothetical protein
VFVAIFVPAFTWSFVGQAPRNFPLPTLLWRSQHTTTNEVQRHGQLHNDTSDQETAYRVRFLRTHCDPWLTTDVSSAAGGGVVVVKVGPDGVQFHVHKPLLVHHSGPWKEAKENLVTLSDVEPGTCESGPNYLHLEYDTVVAR